MQLSQTNSHILGHGFTHTLSLFEQFNINDTKTFTAVEEN